MDEKSLLELWNVKRTQIITAQMGPTLVLITVLVLSAVGAFTSAPDSVKYLAIAVAAATGILAMITQYATIREAQSLVVDLDKLTQKSALSMKIAASKSFLSLTALAFVVIGIGIFVLVVWTVLG
jgi:ABC-type polysaccharide/polyol phosphate export permease